MMRFPFIFTAAFCSLLIACFVVVPTLAQQQPVLLEGRVVDASADFSVPLASVLVESTNTGTATNNDGYFSLRLPPAAYTLRISAVGYETRHMTVAIPAPEPIVVRLQAAVLPMEEVLVQSHAATSNDLAAPQQKLNATEDLLQRVAGVELIQRANFAWEPTIRGLSGGQVGLVIDGMKIYGACVDKMDPASSYVEPENLEKLEVSKGGFDLTQASQIGGTVNLVTERPDFARPYALDVESGFESVAALRRVRVAGAASRGRFAARGSFSYRKADDFAPGGQETITHSGFEKRNYKLSLASQLGDRHQLTASFLGDDAWNVGYPVLLMDATLAQARIYSLAYEGTPAVAWLDEVEGRAYHNHVDHWMDDRFRDVMERDVMRGMYMPMFGYTDTWGGLARLRSTVGKTNVGLTLDAHQVKQFGDMWMFSLFPNIPDMYLLNVGDVVALNTAATLDVRRPLSDRLNVRTNVRFDLSERDVERADMASIFRSRYGIEETARQYQLVSASAVLEYTLRPATRVRLSLANTARLPTNVENYGHYVYNYVDGYFYTGNPDLKPERSRQVELGLEHVSGRLGMRLTGFYNRLHHYIIGISDPGIGAALGGRASTYRFRVYENTQDAYLVGAEASGLYELGRGLDVAASASFAEGHILTLDDPMPMVPPVKGFISLRYDRGVWQGEVESRWALAQNRASEAADEDVTDGFNILNLRASYQVTSELGLKAGIENVFDTFYHEHLSIGNLPSRGRNLFIAVGFSM